MISYLKGKIRFRAQNSLTIDVGGVGYEVEVPTSVLLNHREVGGEVELWVYTRVREDALQLYGFRSTSDRQIFKLLISINKVGPKIALAALSTISPKLMQYAAEHGKHEVFSSVGGIGPTLAQKIIVDLKNKKSKWPQNSNDSECPSLLKHIQLDFDHFGFDGKSIPAQEDHSMRGDIVSALENLGYKSKDISKAISKIDFTEEASQDQDFSTFLKKALQQFRKAPKKTVDPREVF